MTYETVKLNPKTLYPRQHEAFSFFLNHLQNGRSTLDSSDVGTGKTVVAATLAAADRLDAAMIQRAEGWGGVNGLFRFGPDGSVERALAVMQLQTQGGVKTVSPPQQTFASGS